MTGYGKSKFELFGKQYFLDLKSLNSRQLDLFFRTSFELKEFDLELRKIIAESLLRGKIELTISENKVTDSSVNINFSMLEKYFTQIQQFLLTKNMPQSDLIAPLLRHPDIVKSEMPAITAAESAILIEGLKNALDELLHFRKREGETLEVDIVYRINLILDLLHQIEPFEVVRIDKIKEKFQMELNQLQIENDKNRFEQELIYYLEKFDITEEKIRLKAHADYFLALLNEPILEKGKKLNFVIQEIGREINTIGSKANSADIQRVVIQMKDEMEKIKEQLNNVL